MKHVLEQENRKYNGTYGYFTRLKAGLHYGMVAAGEIGSLKKKYSSQLTSLIPQQGSRDFVIISIRI